MKQWFTSRTVGGLHELEVFTILERGIYIVISALGLKTPKSHALRTKNIHCVLCFGAFTFSERITLLHSPALGLPRAPYIYITLLDSLALRTKNIHHVLCFGHSRFQNKEHALSLACLSLEPFTVRIS